MRHGKDLRLLKGEGSAPRTFSALMARRVRGDCFLRANGTARLPIPSIWRIIMAVKRALPPTHPGEILREDVLPALKLSIIDAAAKLGVSRQTLHRIIARRAPRPVTP